MNWNSWDILVSTAVILSLYLTPSLYVTCQRWISILAKHAQLPSMTGDLVSLHHLNLCSTGMLSLPDSICGATKLQRLLISDCPKCRRCWEPHLPSRSVKLSCKQRRILWTRRAQKIESPQRTTGHFRFGTCYGCGWCRNCWFVRERRSSMGDIYVES